MSALPISIGGFGPREFLAQSLFARAGVPGLESVVIQLLAYFVSLILSLFGAVDNGIIELYDTKQKIINKLNEWVKDNSPKKNDDVATPSTTSA